MSDTTGHSRIIAEDRLHFVSRIRLAQERAVLYGVEIR
jgi:hypothetical protein